MVLFNRFMHRMKYEIKRGPENVQRIVEFYYKIYGRESCGIYFFFRL